MARRRFRTQPPRKIGPRNLPPAEMIGVWRKFYPSSAPDFEIQTDGYLYIIQYPVPYSITPDGAVQDWDGWIFNRKAVSGTVIQGVWESDDAHLEEFHFRAGGSFAYHDPNEMPDLFGTYQDTGTHLGAKEVRSVVSIDGNELDADPVFYPSVRFQWTINGDEMSWTEISSGDEQRFNRVP